MREPEARASARSGGALSGCDCAVISLAIALPAYPRRAALMLSRVLSQCAGGRRPLSSLCYEEWQSKDDATLQ